MILGERSCYDEGKRTAETLAMDYHRGAGVEVGYVFVELLVSMYSMLLDCKFSVILYCSILIPGPLHCALCCDFFLNLRTGLHVIYQILFLVSWLIFN